MPNHTVRTHCRICPQKDGKFEFHDQLLTPFLDLGSTPLADRFVTNPKAEEPTFPLTVGFCPQCKGVQLMDIVDDSLLFGKDYAFYTGASPSSIPYFAQYAKDVMRRYPKECKGLIVEVASNDGTLLKHFQDAGCRVQGIEPTENTARVAMKQGVSTLVKPMSTDLAFKWGGEKASIVIGNNVLAHIDELHDFLNGCTSILDDDGVLIFEVQYLPHLIFNNAFDHVYHEHRSFFSLTTLVELMRLHWMTIVNVQEADTQGGSIRIHCRRDPYRELAVSQSVADLLFREGALGITGPEPYLSFQHHIDYTREKLVKTVRDLKRQGKTIYGYGASAKGNTLLNTCHIGTETLDCIVDTTPFKIGKYSPGQHIPVVAPGERPDPDYYLLLVWNYLPGVLKREEKYRASGGHFIVPIPTPTII